MKKTTNKKFKKGAASFYIVAFSTLILVIIAVSFATVVMSEITRTSNDDLAQSAYDSALAGVEDAKLAYMNYRKCVESGVTIDTVKNSGYVPSSYDNGSISCKDIVYWIDVDGDERNRCFMTGRVLGKIYDEMGNISKVLESEVTLGGEKVVGGSGETTTNQAYTCVKITTSTEDIKATLSPSNPIKIMSITPESDAARNSPNLWIILSWYGVRDDASELLKFNNFEFDGAALGKGVTFAAAGNTAATPPTIEFQLIQTDGDGTFKLSDFDKTTADRTDRGTVYLVPTDKINESKRGAGSGNNYIGTRCVDFSDGCLSEKNVVKAKEVVKTNNRSVSNKPFVVYCGDVDITTDEYYCRAYIKPPDAISDTEANGRAKESFMAVVSLPYQKPETDFKLEMALIDPATGNEEIQKILSGQIEVDSTGRANDLFRRVITRLETGDEEFVGGVPRYALQILGAGGASKDFYVTSEYNFKF